jgi:hypothetical protein
MTFSWQELLLRNHLMAEEIRRWEKTSRVPLDSLGKKGLMTLPAVYNVMAMEARKLKKK